MCFLATLHPAVSWRSLVILVAVISSGSTLAKPQLNVEFKQVWSYAHATPSQPKQKSEIVAYDDRTDTLWVAGVAGVDVLSRAWGRQIAHISAAPGAVNSVAINNGLAALAVEAAPDRTQPGWVVLVDTRTRQRIGDPVPVGALPDMLTFVPNGNALLVANEGTPNPRIGPDCPLDPPGSVSLIDLKTRKVETLAMRKDLPGYADLRLFSLQGNGTTRPNMCPYDPEPEYIAVDHTGDKAYVGLQEANGIAVLDLKKRRIEHILGLGLKDFNLPGNGIDPNDQDGAIVLQQVPVKGLYQPDSIAAYVHDGRTYLVMANEGDARDNGDNADGEDERRGSAGNSSIEYVQDNTLLGRLTMSNVESSRDNLVAFGGRSFSIRDDKGRIVFDSGNRLDAEAIKAGIYDHSRSDNKGVEPEGVALMHIEGRVLAFIGLERTLKSAIAIYDVTDPADVRYMEMIVSAGDKAPEGLTAFRVGSRHFLAVANEGTDTTSLFEVSLREAPSKQ